jgi:hypothetical protein
MVSSQPIITTDIDNFWKAYDKIVTTTDTTQQLAYLQKLYIEPATPGLVNIMRARNYTPQAYITAINRYPKFWQSIRANTYKANSISANISTHIEQLRKLYPDLKPAPIYFTIGLFRTNGTATGGMILIGAEMALADKSVVTTELPTSLQAFYNSFTPIDDIGLLVVHEYVHTQQKEIVEELLEASLYEGVAEFISTKATGKPSYSPAIEFGKKNEATVKAKFEIDMFGVNNIYSWLWSSRPNTFNMRDLGYYIGYGICERYYNQAPDKGKAVKELIELDFSNKVELKKLVDQTKFFPNSIHSLSETYEKARPNVVGISQFKNGSQDVDPNLTKVTIQFSESMNKAYRGFEYGPLGESNVLSVRKVIGFSEDGKSFTFEVSLKPNERYQSMVSAAFRTPGGYCLKPYLIDFKTK